MAEVDLDALLRSHGADLSSSDTDDVDGISSAVRRRTVDEILCASSSSSDEDERPPLLRKDLLANPNDNQRPVRAPSPPIHDTLEEEPPESLSWRRKSSWPSSSDTLSSLVLRRFSHAAASSSSSSSSRPLPPLFRGIRPNPKPGAALAAAAAASRSVPTPHAAAIKSRKAESCSFQKVAEEMPTDNLKERVGSEALDEADVPEDIVLSGKLRVEDDVDGSTAASSEAEVMVVSEEVNAQESSSCGAGPCAAEETTTTEELDGKGDMTSNSSIHDENAKDEEDLQNPVEDVNENATEAELDVFEAESNGLDTCSFRDADITFKEEKETQLEDEIENVVEERSDQLEINRKAEKKAEKKLRASIKPLEWAEELEKRQASSGMHWEEGAAAQPMRLEGIRRGPPAVGYLQIDLDNAITRIISSQAFRRDHGFPQALAIHMNFIALGTSKGAVLVVPSKYSTLGAENIDSKVLIFGTHGEKVQSSVTSMCFNQQGDLLLAGYGDGHLTVWDVQKVAAAKVIIGEHTAPVVHALFLGQDSQVTRQFKAITGDSKGLVVLHTFSVFSVVPLLNRFSVKTQCLLDGPKNGIVLSACPLLVDSSNSLSNISAQGNSAISTSGLGSMVGGVVGGVVGGEGGWKLFNEGSSFVEEGVVIFVTHQNALVVRLSPNVEVYEKFSRPEGAREGSMPYTAWKCTTLLHDSSLDASERVSWLAIAWDRQVQVAKLVKSEMKRHKEWNLDSAAIGVAWLDDQMLLVLTFRGQLCLFSKDGNELHRTSFVLDGLEIDDIITYHTHFSNVFGNPEKAYHNSVAVRGATVYILGPMHLIVSRLLPWKERIQVLQRAGDWMGALDMAMRLYDGHSEGVIDLPRTVGAIREAIMPFLVELLLSYVDEVFSYISVAVGNQVGKGGPVEGPNYADGSLRTEIEEQYARVGGVAVEFCVHIKRSDILFDNIFSKFVAVQHGGTFLEILEPYILKDMLGSLPPEIMQALVEHYSGKGWLQRVEQCVLHMDISSVDFNQVVKLCREHGLYGALIYLFNQGLDDFRTPLEELLAVVQNSPRKDAAAISYRMLVYLKYCFQGLAFPPGHGILSYSRVRSVRHELMLFLLEDSKSLTSQIFKSFKSSCETCPNLCYLLWLDTEATMEVLKCALMEEGREPLDNSTNNAIVPPIDNGQDDFGRLEDHNIMVQKISNKLIDVLGLENELIRSIVLDGDMQVWPSEKDLSHLLEFITFLVSFKQATISQRVLKHVFEYLTSPIVGLCTPNLNAVASQKEKQVLTLLRAIPQTKWNSDDMLHLCEKAQFHQACGIIHMIRGQNIAALDSYMKDVREPIHAFAFINKMLLQLANSEALSFRSEVICRIPELAKLSRSCTFFLVIDHFSSESKHILSKLHSHPQSLFLLLKTAIEVHLSGTLNISELEIDHLSNNPVGIVGNTSNEIEAFVERLRSPKLLHHNAIHITDDLVEEYLELLCQFERTSVLQFLETFDNYRLEHCLRLCQDYGITDAAAFLLERVGDVASALVLMITGLNEKFKLLIAAVENTLCGISSSNLTEIGQPSNILKMNEAILVLDVLHASIALCQRNSQRLDPQESESLWFRLFDSFSEPLKRFSSDKDIYELSWLGKMPAIGGDQVNGEESPLGRPFESKICFTLLRRVFSQFVGEIIEGMAGYIPLPVIMAKLLSDNRNQEFGDFKIIIIKMLETYGYEKRILETAKSVIEDDTFYTFCLLRKGVSHAFAPEEFRCCICNCSLNKGSASSGVRVYKCGHSTHVYCESEESMSSNKVSLSGCPVCFLKKDSHARNKLVDVENGLVNYDPSKLMHSQGVLNVQHLHESDIVERPRGIQQMSRLEILSNLQKAQKSFQIDILPQLRLSPPAIYHEKVQKGASLIGETSNNSLKTEKHKPRQHKELKSKGPVSRFPLRKSILRS
ncbi:uncharacterized protein [Typha latifolia]|uniref:uncharacterized protein isoform X1 n=1 Tax=Typha latifolia TaxID=4733 RepID=UPI003C30DBF8